MCRVVWKERDWRICLGVLVLWRVWRREVRFWLRVDSEMISESRREEEEGVRRADNSCMRD